MDGLIDGWMDGWVGVWLGECVGRSLGGRLALLDLLVTFLSDGLPGPSLHRSMN